MHNGRLYLRYNKAQRASAIELLDDFAHNFTWPVEGAGTLLDIGTGPGDVLTDFVVPRVPKNTKIVGSDISMEMIQFAKQNFENEFVTFRQADISADYKILKEKFPNLFDNITSFFCFHWIQNQK